MNNDIYKDTEKSMEKSIASLKNQISKIRTGKANVTMLDSIRIDYYGTPSPLNQMAAISCPDAKSFLIVPWEVSMLKEIEQSIIKSDIGMTPINDGKVIRLKLPDLTEERRKELVKNVKKLIEDTRVSVRLHRQEANSKIKQLLKNKEISEDDNKNLQEKIQKLTDIFISQIDEIGVKKEKDILTI